MEGLSYSEAGSLCDTKKNSNQTHRECRTEWVNLWTSSYDRGNGDYLWDHDDCHDNDYGDVGEWHTKHNACNPLFTTILSPYVVTIGFVMFLKPLSLLVNLQVKVLVMCCCVVFASIVCRLLLYAFTTMMMIDQNPFVETQEKLLHNVSWELTQFIHNIYGCLINTLRRVRSYPFDVVRWDWIASTLPDDSQV